MYLKGQFIKANAELKYFGKDHNYTNKLINI